MKKGFTLIELLVVIVIVGILVASALPAYKKAVERTRNAELQLFLNPTIRAVQYASYKENPENLTPKEILPFEFTNSSWNEDNTKYETNMHSITASCDSGNVCTALLSYPAKKTPRYTLKIIAEKDIETKKICIYYQNDFEHICDYMTSYNFTKEKGN